MEAILGANVSTMTGCAGIVAEPPHPLASKSSPMQLCDCAVLRKPLAARCGLGIARGARTRWLASAVPFRDQSHCVFYDVGPRAGQGGSRNSSFAIQAVSGEAIENDGAEIGMADLKLRKKMEKKEKKREKKMRKAATKKEGSSSESSESEPEDIKVERSSPRRRINMDDWRAEWEAVTSSPLQRGAAIETEVLSSDSVRMPPSRRTADVPGRSEDRFPAERDVLLQRQRGMEKSAATGVEVCMNSTCRKAGSQEVLSAFQAQGVNAVGCRKCMKNCENAITLRVGLADGKTEMHSRVGLEDVHALSQRYFAAREMSTGRLSSTSDSGTRDGRQLACH